MANNQTTSSTQLSISTSQAAEVILNNFLVSLKKGLDNISQTLQEVIEDLGNNINDFKTNRIPTDFGYKAKSSFKLPNFNFKLPTNLKLPNFKLPTNKNVFKISGGILLVIVVLFGAFIFGRSTQKNIPASYADTRPLAPNVKAEQAVNKTFEFPLTDDKGVIVSKIKYKITNAQLQDSIIVNGQKANAVVGRTFLVLNLEITNAHTQGIEINSRDYIRLTVNGKTDLIAADIHNDPVAVQAISTKITRLGFPINDTDKNLKLQIGEIKGKKEIIDLTLNR